MSSKLPPKIKILEITVYGHNNFVIKVSREDGKEIEGTIDRDSLLNLKEYIEALLEVI